MRRRSQARPRLDPASRREFALGLGGQAEAGLALLRQPRAEPDRVVPGDADHRLVGAAEPLLRPERRRSDPRRFDIARVLRVVHRSSRDQKGPNHDGVRRTLVAPVGVGAHHKRPAGERDQVEFVRVHGRHGRSRSGCGRPSGSWGRSEPAVDARGPEHVGSKQEQERPTGRSASARPSPGLRRPREPTIRRPAPAAASDPGRLKHCSEHSQNALRCDSVLGVSGYSSGCIVEFGVGRCHHQEARGCS